MPCKSCPRLASAEHEDRVENSGLLSNSLSNKEQSDEVRLGNLSNFNDEIQLKTRNRKFYIYFI